MLPYPQCSLICAPAIKASFTVLPRQGRGVILYSATAGKGWSQVSSSHSLWSYSPLTPQTRANSLPAAQMRCMAYSPKCCKRWLGHYSWAHDPIRDSSPAKGGEGKREGRALSIVQTTAQQTRGRTRYPCPCPPCSWSESPKSRASSTLLLNQGRLSLEAGFEIIYAHVWPVCRQPLFAACGWRFIALGYISSSNKNLPENYHDSRQDNNEINLWNCKSAPATFFAL